MNKEQKHRMLSEAHHYAKKQGDFEYESSREDFIEGYKRAFALYNVVQQSEQYCECEKPTLGKSISRCGTCDEWFKPLK